MGLGYHQFLKYIYLFPLAHDIIPLVRLCKKSRTKMDVILLLGWILCLKGDTYQIFQEIKDTNFFTVAYWLYSLYK